MALSGSVNTTSYDGRYLVLSWTATQDIATNTSTISWTLKGAGTGGSDWYRSGPFEVVINGVTTTIPKTDPRLQLYNGTVVKTGSTKITHNNDGTKSFNISVKGAIWSGSMNCSGSKNFTLNTIPRASSFGTITGNTIGSSVTVNITRNSTAFTHQLWYKVGNSEWYDLGAGIGTSKTFTIDMATCSQFPSATSGTMQLCIRTFNGTTQIGSDVYKNVTVYVPTSVVPVIGGISWTKTSTEPSTWPMTQGVTKGTMTMTGVEGKYGSTIKSYSLTFAGFSSTAISLAVTNIASSGKLNAIAKVTDSRGRTAEKSVEFTVMAYDKPKLTVEVYRSNASGVEDDYGEYMYVKATVEITDVGDNALQSLVLQYKKHSDYSYKSENLTPGTAKIIAASSDYTWDWVITATDKVYPVIANDSIGTGEVVLDIMADGSGIGLGKVAEIPGAIDSAWNLAVCGQIEVDFVIEQGTSGVWTYRKWASGIAECWGEDAFSISGWKAWGSLYESTNTYQATYPSELFIDIPLCKISVSRTNNIGTCGLDIFSGASKTQTPICYALRPSTGATGTIHLSLFARGRWK